MEKIKPYSLVYANQQEDITPYMNLPRMIYVSSEKQYAETIQELGIPTLLIIHQAVLSSQHWIQTMVSYLNFSKKKKRKFPKFFSFKILGNKAEVEPYQTKLLEIIADYGTVV